MKHIQIYFLIASTLLFSHPSFAKCTYELDSSSTQVTWTAFKTMQKVGVTGSFPEVTVAGKTKKNGTLAQLLDQLKATITADAVEKIHTGNAGRDQTLIQHFFGLFKAKSLIQGTISKTKGTDTEGDFDLNLTMNEKTLAVPMHFKRDAAGKLEAKGEIDVLKFELDKALADLHQSCEAVHKGADGVSKTWPNVEIKISAQISQKCSS